MEGFIELTESDGKKILINKDNIKNVRQNGSSAQSIVLTNDGYLNINESYEEIKILLL